MHVGGPRPYSRGCDTAEGEESDGWLTDGLPHTGSGDNPLLYYPISREAVPAVSSGDVEDKSQFLCICPVLGI